MNLRSIGFVLIAHLGLAQSPAAPAPRPEFEVASVKPSAPGRRGSSSRFLPGGRWTAQNASVHFLIQEAYRVSEFQITGGPAWMNNEGYDIAAKGPDGAASQDRLRLMMQALLVDRFHLMSHPEAREMPVYFLTVSKGGMKLVEPKEGGCVPRSSGPPVLSPGQPLPNYCGLMVVRPGGLDGSKIAMGQLTMFFSNVLGRSVIDKTDFKGTFDVHLRFARDEALAQGMVGDDVRGGPGAPPPSPESSVPSIFTAVQEQLGLRLEPGKGPVELLVIDHVERPSEN